MYLLEILFYFNVAVIYFGFCLVVFMTESNHNFIKTLRFFTLPLIFWFTLVVLLIAKVMLLKSYVQIGHHAFKKENQ